MKLPLRPSRRLKPSTIAGDIETIVLNLGGAEERETYLALADEYNSYADELDEPGLRNPRTERPAFGTRKADGRGFQRNLARMP